MDNIPSNTSSSSIYQSSNNNTSFIICTLIWLELIIIHPIILIIANTNLFVLLTTRVLHPNMSVILIVQSISIIGFEIFCQVGIIEQLILSDFYYTGSIIIQKCGFFFVLIRNLVGHILLIERLLATCLYKSYEHYRKVYFSVGWITVVTILAIGIYNNHKYNKHLPQGNNYSLSEKYQLADNIRTSKQLIPVFFCHFFNGCIMLFFSIFMYFSLFNHQQLAISIQVSTILSSIVDFTIEFTIITHHPQLRKRFLYICSKTFLFKCTKNKVTQEVKQIEDNAQRSTSGKLIKNKGNSEHHFNMLKNAWQ
uniref:G_PROTEIN_RECEP_F1_2 domain-containing protein n=1 Tax=Meloidogyne hapla TaxID=6305 RepID=A0A1I8BHV5_MELHA